MELENIKKNVAGKILQFSIPAIIAMVLTSMITIVDGYFMGNYVGKEAIAAVNLGLPILYLYLALGLMLSVGGVAIAGMALGAENYRKAKAVFNQTMITTVFVSCMLSIVVLILFTPIMHLFHAEALVGEYFRKYYLILL